MPDLPDWYSAVEASLTKAINLTSGLDAAKAASPTVGDVYVATDTTIVYVCYAVGTWTNIGALYLLLAGGTMSGAIAMGANKVTGLAAPTAAGDALRKGTRVTVAELPALTDEKIWKGTGANVEEVDMPVAGAALTVAETEVFSGTAPTSWTDLDLSGTVGANSALVLLKVYREADYYAAFRKNGDTDEFYVAEANTKGVAIGYTSGQHCVVLVATDDAGKVEWITGSATAGWTVDIIAYIK